MAFTQPAAVFVAVAVLGVRAAPAPGQEAPRVGEFVPLFNGKDLTGWTPKVTGSEHGVNFRDTFRVEDGVIKVSYDKYPAFKGEFGHLFYKDKFSHYVLRVEYRFVGTQVKGGPGWATRNSGVMLHCQDPKTMRVDQEFPVSVEAQFLGGLGKGKRPTLSVCTPGTNIVMDGKLITRHCNDSKSKTFDGDQWVTAEVEVRGAGKVNHRVNGEVVMEYEQPQLDPTDPDAKRLIEAQRPLLVQPGLNGSEDRDAKKLIRGAKLLLEEGYVALQAESHPVEFRKVEIKLLSK